MTTPCLRARRATVEDLPQLIGLWRLEQLPADALERRFTEFQVVPADDGTILACLGLEISGSAGRLYGESIAVPERADEMRDLLWSRVQNVCRNHALDRLWTAMTLPYWRARGFAAASDTEAEGMPSSFLREQAQWQVLKLKPEEASSEAIEKQFAMFKAVHQAESERMARRARTLKTIALSLTVIVFGLVLAWAVVLLKWGPRFLQRQ